MTWASRAKTIKITKDVPHLNHAVGLVEGHLGATDFNFTPAELFGAMAQCSHLHTFDPRAASVEWTMAQILVQHHVDDTTSEFETLKSVNSLKDFMKGNLAGAIAAGIAHLTMIKNGYDWHAHFEKVAFGNSKVKKRPDFVFLDGHHNAALVESKGSATGSLSSLDKRTEKGYIDQVEPHLGSTSHGIVADRGFCIGTFIKPKSNAQIRVHRTSVPATPGTLAPLSGPSPAAGAIIRADLARVFAMVHSPQLGLAVSLGEPPPSLTFLRANRHGYNWLFWRPWFSEFDPLVSAPFGWILAIEQLIAERALIALTGEQNAVSTRGRPERVPRSRLFEQIEPFMAWSSLTGTRDFRDAYFPDGMAVLESKALDLDLVRWDGKARFVGN